MVLFHTVFYRLFWGGGVAKEKVFRVPRAEAAPTTLWAFTRGGGKSGLGFRI